LLGVPVVPRDDTPAWLVQLHRVLNRDDESVPAVLQTALIEIADLATELGHEMIVTHAIERDVDLFVDHKTLTRQDLAFYVHHRHPGLFRAVHARLQPQDVPCFVEFCGNRSATLSRQAIEKQLEAARVRLSGHFQVRNRIHFCRAWSEELGDDIAFMFVRGGAPHAVPSLDTDANLLATYVPEKHDIVVYTPEVDRLSICTYPTDQAYYRAIMGLLVASDEAYLNEWPAFRADPLKARGSAALDVSGVPELVRVCLTKITLLGRDERESNLQFISEDLGPSLDQGPLRAVVSSDRSVHGLSASSCGRMAHLVRSTFYPPTSCASTGVSRSARFAVSWRCKVSCVCRATSNIDSVSPRSRSRRDQASR